ncbi:MAG TPA: hypothetical protein VFB78_02075 [Acidimicrobiales bacterium]|nr:hypothetical protein [Acidimicrobiales bacterium]
MAIASLEDALKAVAEVAPVAREYCQKAEDRRGLPVEVVDAIEGAGLWRAFAPTEVGGANLVALGEQFEIVRAMAYEDTSAAWGLFICGVGAALVGAKLPAQGREEVFANGVVPMAGVFNPGGSAQLTADGLVVNGKWPFASGIGYAGWAMANAIVLDESGAPRPGIGGLPEIRSVVVAIDDLTIIDDWHVAGLRGTGSMSFTMDGVTVPEHRTFPFFGPTTDAGHKYRLPLVSLIGPPFAAMAVGLADRLVDELLALLPTRVGPPTFQPASADPVNQSTVGRAMAAVHGARESTRAIFARYDARLAAGEDLTALPLDGRAELHRHIVWAAATCRDAVNELFLLAGASSIYEPGVIQRIWRDINVLNQHVYLRLTNFENAGKVALGFDVATPLF